MTSPLSQLIRLLDVKQIEANTFCGDSQDLGFRNLFGGHVLAQALVAAYKTVESGRFCHSLHGYFLRLGKTDQPIFYEVDLIRSGQSFTTRRVVAKQGGVAIFTMSASFQRVETGFTHQARMPDVPGPDGWQSELDRVRALGDKIPESIRDNLTADRPIEVRVVDPVDYFAPQARDAVKNSWFRTIGDIDTDDPVIHQAILAYASDFGLASTAGLPHGVSFFQPGVQVASLDHSIWFHRPVKLNGWMLYSKDGPSAAGSRGFNRGQIFSADGVHVASVAQESLIRKKQVKKQESRQEQKGQSAKKKNSQSGFTLIEILVAVGLMGLLALGIAEIYRQQMYVQDKVRDRGALEDLRNVVRSVVNCQYPCVANVARIPTNQGRWQLMPLCDQRGLQVLVSDSKKRAPEKTSSLFSINEGYICLYLDEPAVVEKTQVGPDSGAGKSEDLERQVDAQWQELLQELSKSISGSISESTKDTGLE